MGGRKGGHYKAFTLSLDDDDDNDDYDDDDDDDDDDDGDDATPVCRSPHVCWTCTPWEPGPRTSLTELPGTMADCSMRLSIYYSQVQGSSPKFTLKKSLYTVKRSFKMDFFNIRMCFCKF